MNDPGIFAFGCAVMFVFLAGAYVAFRDSFTSAGMSAGRRREGS